MATDYSLNLKAQLDTSDVQLKLQQLGQVGTTVNNLIDLSVKNLDKSVKQLATSFDLAAKQQAQMGRLALRMGATYIGHLVLGNIASQNAGTTTGALAGIGAGALGGAAMGAGAGPAGIAVGAAIGALTSALDELNKSAKAATDEIIRQAEAQQKQIRAWHTAKADVELQQQLRGVTAALAGDLRAQASATRARYESFMTGEEGKKFAQEYKGDDFVNARDRYMKNLLKQLQVEEALAAQAEKLLDAENKEADAAKRKAEADEKAAQIAEERANAEKTAVAKSAAGALGSFLQQQRLQAFGLSLQDLTPAELQNMKDNLVEQNSALAGRVTDLFAYALTTGSAADLEAALNALSEFNEGSTMLKMVEGLLGGISGAGEAGLSTLQSMQALGSEAQKGYDVGGYGNIDQQILKVGQETKDATKESAGTLRSINTKLDEVKNVITSNSNGATWG